MKVRTVAVKVKSITLKLVFPTRGRPFFASGGGQGWRYWVLNLVPRKFGMYFELAWGASADSTEMADCP